MGLDLTMPLLISFIFRADGGSIAACNDLRKPTFCCRRGFVMMSSAAKDAPLREISSFGPLSCEAVMAQFERSSIKVL